MMGLKPENLEFEEGTAGIVQVGESLGLNVLQYHTLSLSLLYLFANCTVARSLDADARSLAVYCTCTAVCGCTPVNQSDI
jgi:hypothetical protein